MPKAYTCLLAHDHFKKNISKFVGVAIHCENCLVKFSLYILSLYRYSFCCAIYHQKIDIVFREKPKINNNKN